MTTQYDSFFSAVIFQTCFDSCLTTNAEGPRGRPLNLSVKETPIELFHVFVEVHAEGESSLRPESNAGQFLELWQTRANVKGYELSLLRHCVFSEATPIAAPVAKGPYYSPELINRHFIFYREDDWRDDSDTIDVDTRATRRAAAVEPQGVVRPSTAHCRRVQGADGAPVPACGSRVPCAVRIATFACEVHKGSYCCED